MSELDVTDGRGPWKQFICRACGLIYNEGEGDPDSGLAPGTRFEDIPDDWECPLCGVTKTDFEPYVRRERPVTAGAPRVKRARQPGIVIVGAGTAGWSAAEAVRELSPDIPITMVTGDAGNRYNKPELSVALSRGLSPEQLCRQTGAEAAAELNIRLMPQTTAVGLSAAQHRLRTTRGSIPYKSLILALGARPVLPPSLPPELCWRVNDLNAWIGLRRQLGDAPREVAVVGAGMVGCEIAEDLARSGHSIILLNNSPLPLQRLLPDIASERIVRGLSGLGIRFFGGVRATAARREGSDTICLSTDCGLAFEPQVVIAATGLATETRLVRTAGLAFNHGIAVCHDTLCSSIPDVYALGDCISIDGTPCRYIEPIARQAEAIAHAALGREHTGYQHAPPIIRLKTKSTPLVIKGVPIENGNWRVIEDSEARLLMEQWHDDKLVARLAA